MGKFKGTSWIWFTQYSDILQIPTSTGPPLIYSLIAIYIPSFISSFLTQVPYDVVSDEVDLIVVDREVEQIPSSYAEAAAEDSAIGRPKYIEEDVELEETIVLEERERKLWRTLLTGLPSPTSHLLSLITFLINIALVLMATDLIYRARVYYPENDLSFARVGYVSDTEAKILIREPDQSKLPIFVSIKNASPQPPVDDELVWRPVAEIQSMTNDTDYTAVLTIPLRSKKRITYEYKTTNNHTGFFTTGMKPGYTSKHGQEDTFTFLTSSCVTQRFPYKPLDHPLSIPGFKHLAKVLPSLHAQFMLFLGDFIYIDVPKRFGSSIEDYRRDYRQVYASPDWPGVSKNLSWIHVIDDHEIANDFDASENSTIYRNALDPFRHYQIAANPPVARKAGIWNVAREGATYFEFTQGPASFFMLDTRRYRDSSTALPADAAGKSMLGSEQLADLLAWLARPVPAGVKWKFVISSIPFTKNWRVNSADTWSGFLDERQKILEAMWDVGLRGGVGVVVLSGDRHEFAATAFPPPEGGRWPLAATVNEFSTSPLSQFYLPFRTYRETDESDIMVK
jgi:alkaline phosphatase D